ncbi:MAG: ATP-binding cassette domain-containing protein, partial [Eubacteriales bacterium]
MIEVKNLVKTFDRFRALDDLTLTVPQGSIYGLVGPNGAGKSTVIRHITGVMRQDSGSVTIGGQPIYENVAIKSKMANIPDDLFHYPQANIREMKRFYQGIYPGFDTILYEKLKEIFQLDEKQPMRRL